MDSRTAAHVLSEIADLLGLNAENRFKSRAYRTTDNALVEGKNGAVVRKYTTGGVI